MSRYDYYGFEPRMGVGEKRALAERTLVKLRKKDPQVRPVTITGTAIARSWWGKAWNANLERYADYAYRLERGRSYVRNGLVLDLRVAPGSVESLVQGTRATPYEVSIRVKALAAARWKKIKAAFEGRLESLQDILAGRFPEDLADVLTGKGTGLFPSPGEIEFSCTCPDWASMCKHVAGALLGIGARLDEDPILLFHLRQVEIGGLISQAVQDRTRKLLAKAETKSARTLDDTDLAGVFGIELEEEAGKGTPAPAPSAPPAGGGIPDAQLVAGIVRRSRKEVDVATLTKRTGLPAGRIYAIVRRLKAKGEICSAGWGLYRGC